ncbi:MAG: DUF3782 domain-containing protein [Prochlorotrichaceae cyanobacterium]|jgi:hypothetical protein
MSTPITIEDIYKLFERSQQENDRRAAEADRRAAEAKAEADRRAVEADRRFQDLELVLAQSRQEAEAFRQETERIEAETRARAQASIDEIQKMVGRLTDCWGLFVESLVRAAALDLFQERGLSVHEVFPRGMRGSREGLEMQVDVFVVDDDRTEAIAIEVKSHLTQEYVDDFLSKLPNFKTLFPAYRGYTIYGGVAGIDIDQGVDRYAYKQGLFVLRQSGNLVEIANDDRFRPKAW